MNIQSMTWYLEYSKFSPGVFPDDSVVKNLPANSGDTGDMDPWVRKIPRGREWQSLQYSCLEDSMDRGAWRATVHGVAKSRTQLSD